MRVLGIMSGTSLDSIDLALAEFALDRAGDLQMRLVGEMECPWPAEVRHGLLAVLPPATSDVATWCRLDTAAGQAFGAAAASALTDLGPADLVCCHGQTLFHWVDDGVALGTLQVGAPAWIRRATGLPVVNDLRTADVAAGGQGAPLASVLDAMWLGDQPTAALNLGGIANITVVGAGPVVCGDTGPASCLLDVAAEDHLGRSCDIDGEAARRGQVHPEALRRLLTDPFYARPFPRSTGRELFHRGYVTERLAGLEVAADDLFATLTELTARTVADAVALHPVERVVASGGGVRNPALMARLRALLGVPLIASTDLGMPAHAKEAYLMTLLGYLSAQGIAAIPTGASGRTVTGADRAEVLGSLTPPHSPRDRRIRRLVLTEES